MKVFRQKTPQVMTTLTGARPCVNLPNPTWLQNASLELFPRGIVDPFEKARSRGVSFADCVQHLMWFADRTLDGPVNYRFASPHTSRYWFLDAKMRMQAVEQSRLFFIHNRDQAQMSVKEVRERPRENVSSIIGSTTRYTANVSGSDGFWLSQQESSKAQWTSLIASPSSQRTPQRIIIGTICIA